MAQGKILVIRGGAIGDFILTFPVLAALRRRFPQARLEVLGYPHIAELAIAAGLADAVRSIEAGALAGFFAKGGRLDEALQDYFSEFDLVFSYLYDPDLIFQENLSRCCLGQYIAGPHRPDDTSGIHAAKALLEPLRRVAIFDADPVPRLRLERPSSGARRLAVHPGSGSERKNWAEAAWADMLGRLCATTDISLLIVGGEAEGSRIERLAATLPSDRVQVARSLPLPKLAHELAGCRAFVGHDSGISHLAAALGLPVLALWGETRREVWQPLGAQVRILSRPNGLPALTASEVLTEVLAIIQETPAERKELR